MDKTNETVVIAIDGPAASGKSTVARELAKRLGCRFFNSGDLYRAMTYACLRSGVDCRDASAVAAAAGAVLMNIAASDHEYFPEIDGEDARPFLRSDEVNTTVSPVSAVPEVRLVVTRAIRASVRNRQAVIEGRDIGSAVFPETPFKFYIDADPRVRQMRRSSQGQSEDVTKRDKMDSSRSAAPLTVAEGATVIDSSHLDVDGVVAATLHRLAEQGLAGAITLCSKE
jgi:cytidylate kinase